MKRTFLYTALLFSFRSAAQEAPAPSDSLYFYGQSARKLQLAYSSTTQLLAMDVKNAAQAQLFAGRQGGSYRRAAEAYAQTNAGFQTNGINTLGRFKLSGSFAFEKQWQDSLAWSQQGEYNEAQPYYFFAGKAGQSERLQYRLHAAAATNIWKNKLFLGLSGWYRYSWLTRSVDPRPDVTGLQTNFQPAITYKHGRHTIGAGFLWGRGSETNNISYKNANFNGNQLYQDRINFMSLGFGYIGKLDRNLSRYDDYSGFSVDYALRLRNWNLQARGGYELWQQDISTALVSTRDRHTVYAFLQQDKVYGEAVLSNDKAGGHQQLAVSFATQSLLNWASEFNATSYQCTGTQAELSYSYLLGAGSRQLEFIAGVFYKELFKEDVVAAHAHELRLAEPRIQLGYYSRRSGKNALYVALSPSLRLPLTNTLAVPGTQENYYTTGVVYTDYLYWEQKAWKLDLKASCHLPSAQLRNRLGLSLHAWYQEALGQQLPALPAQYVPHGKRLGFSAALNLYL